MGKLWIDQVGGYGSEVMGPAWPRLAPRKGRGGWKGAALLGCMPALPGVPTTLLPLPWQGWGGGFLELLMALLKASSSVGQGVMGFTPLPASRGAGGGGRCGGCSQQ